MEGATREPEQPDQPPQPEASGEQATPEQREPSQLTPRQIGLMVAAVSALILLVSALAEPLGIGAGGGWGWKQYVGTAVGVFGVLVGLAIAYAPKRAA